MSFEKGTRDVAVMREAFANVRIPAGSHPLVPVIMAALKRNERPDRQGWKVTRRKK